MRATVLPSSARQPTGIEDFAAETLTFVREMTSADGITMHVFDENAQRIWLGSRGIPGRFRSAYYDGVMWRIDPLAAVRMGGGSCPLVELGAAERHCDRPNVHRYRSFLGSFGIVDAAEMVFASDGGEHLGGISLLWTHRVERSARREHDLLQSLQRYIQLSFRKALQGTPIGWRRTVARVYRLTRREVQIVELVCAGHSNAQLAQHLDLSVATVKTHLQHVFEKLGVSKRAALVRRALGTSSWPG
jgi:DNA-binding CsgD family transcriptional regulator